MERETIKERKMFCFIQRLNNGWVPVMVKYAARSDFGGLLKYYHRQAA